MKNIEIKQVNLGSNFAGYGIKQIYDERIKLFSLIIFCNDKNKQLYFTLVRMNSYILNDKNDLFLKNIPN